MTLPAGTRFGPYEIQVLLGAGGMGEVYRARDRKLDRDVAIKIPSEAFAADPDRISRFEREAKTLAALNHPNIAHIHGLEEADDIHALVMELVDGPTLAERIREGPMPIAEALAIGGQLAEALAAAHEQGIVHRDLKPANIKITPAGLVKVLDFGLAKTVIGNKTDPRFWGGNTATFAHTAEGIVLGTPAYMSPEQARGKAVDKRTDIWAFGCVLYEMLVGRAVFAGETGSDTIAAILEREPDWNGLPRNTPLGVRRLLQRCLEKDAARRLRDILDAAAGLEEGVGDTRSSATRPVGRVLTREHLAWVCVALLFVALITTAIVTRLSSGSGTAPGAIRTTILLPVELQLDRRGIFGYHVAVSPDGARIAYVAARDGRHQLYVREFGEFEAKVLPDTDEARQPFFSPDGRWVAFFAGGELRKVAVTGGTPLRICEAVRNTIGGSWARDGTIVFAVEDAPLSRVPASGGVPRTIPGSDAAIWPEILPDGKTVLFTVDEAAIATVPLDGGSKHIVAKRSDFAGDGPSVIGPGEIEQARYAPTGLLIYGQGLQVFAVPFDAGSLMVSGSPVPVLNSVFRSSGGGAVSFAVANNGVVVYTPEGRHELVWVSRDGRAEPIVADRERFRFPSLSRDGKHIAVVVVSETRRSDIWIYDVGNGGKTRLAEGIMPVWAPDGRVAYNRDNLYLQASDGGDKTEVLIPGPTNWPTSWSAGARTLLFNRSRPATKLDLWAVAEPFRTSQARALVAGAGIEGFGRFSPDDRWIAYSSDESGRSDVYVISYPDLKGKTAVSIDGGAHPVWSRDGRTLFYRRGTAVMSAVVSANGVFHAEKPQVLFDGPYVGQGGDTTFDIGPDGRFLLVRGDDAAMGRQLDVVSNWFSELKAHVAR